MAIAAGTYSYHSAFKGYFRFAEYTLSVTVVATYDCLTTALMCLVKHTSSSELAINLAVATVVRQLAARWC
jgi:hypothetical protein